MAPVHTCAQIGPDAASSGTIGPDRPRPGLIGPDRDARSKKKIMRPDLSQLIPEQMYIYALCVKRTLGVCMYAPCACCYPCSMCLSRSTNKYVIAYDWCYYADIACIFGAAMLAPCVRMRVLFSARPVTSFAGT